MVKNVVIGSPGSAFKAQFNVKNLAIGLEVIEEIEIERLQLIPLA